MQDIKSLEEAFKKVQQMESDVDVSIPLEKDWLEDKIEMLHKTIRELNLKKTNVWCSIVRRKDIQRMHANTKQYEWYK